MQSVMDDHHEMVILKRQYIVPGKPHIIARYDVTATRLAGARRGETSFDDRRVSCPHACT